MCGCVVVGMSSKDTHKECQCDLHDDTISKRIRGRGYNHTGEDKKGKEVSQVWCRTCHLSAMQMMAHEQKRYFAAQKKTTKPATRASVPVLPDAVTSSPDTPIITPSPSSSDDADDAAYGSSSPPSDEDDDDDDNDDDNDDTPRRRNLYVEDSAKEDRPRSKRRRAKQHPQPARKKQTYTILSEEEQDVCDRSVEEENQSAERFRYSKTCDPMKQFRYSSSYTHIVTYSLTSSRPHKRTSSHTHILTSSHPHTVTSSQSERYTSSNVIFTLSYPHLP